MDSKVVYNSTNHKTSIAYLVPATIFMYILCYLNHGFLIYGSDTIETLPYAMKMNNPDLLMLDFHLTHLSESLINERFFSTYFLHLFGENLEWGSRILHAIFGLSLIAGMIRFADIHLKHFTLSTIAVFITLIAIYNINIGANELYYNFYNSSIAAKSIAIWALVRFVEKKWVQAGVILGISTLFQPLVGFQLFVILSTIQVLTKGFKSETWKFLAGYLPIGGLFVVLILGAQGPKVDQSVYTFFEIIRFRIGHHFFPEFFPLKHVLVLLGLYGLGIWYSVRRNKFFAMFFAVGVFGAMVYLLGIFLKIDLVLSSQWMKVNIWLKFIGVIALIAVLKDLVERKQLIYLSVALFSLSLIVSLVRFSPTYDASFPSDIYTWVNIHSKQDDVFLVPPELIDFKARTARSSYFDFKAMLHHKPHVYDWFERFEEIYGLQPDDRKAGMNISTLVGEQYLKGEGWQNKAEINYILSRNTQELPTKQLVYKGKEYSIFKY